MFSIIIITKVGRPLVRSKLERTWARSEEEDADDGGKWSLLSSCREVGVGGVDGQCHRVRQSLQTFINSFISFILYFARFYYYPPFHPGHDDPPPVINDFQLRTTSSLSNNSSRGWRTGLREFSTWLDSTLLHRGPVHEGDANVTCFRRRILSLGITIGIGPGGGTPKAHHQPFPLEENKLFPRIIT